MAANPGMNNNIPPNEAALSSVNELLKILTSLATGALVFSIGLAAPVNDLHPVWIKVVLIMAWLLLVLSIFCGIYGQSLVPLQINNASQDINAPELRISAMLLETFFFFGIVGIAITLGLTLLSTPMHRESIIKSPFMAVSSARSKLASTCLVTQVNLVELVKGTDPDRMEESTWHIQFETAPEKARSKASPAKMIDVYLNPVTKESLILGE